MEAKIYILPRPGVKCGRGRPRKNPFKDEEDHLDDLPDPKLNRERGRPRKDSTIRKEDYMNVVPKEDHLPNKRRSGRLQEQQDELQKQRDEELSDEEDIAY